MDCWSQGTRLWPWILVWSGLVDSPDVVVIWVLSTALCEGLTADDDNIASSFPATATAPTIPQCYATSHSIIKSTKVN